jgi:pimeloyl-ACP methyl ester carboxylesterase
VAAESALPWTTIFSSDEDAPLLEAFRDDPLRVRRFEFRLAGSMLKNMPPPVPFEQCRTPVQVIASEQSGLWPYEMNVRYFERLGGPKELVTLTGKDQWEYTLEFHEQYAAHVMRWFTQQGAFDAPPVTAQQAEGGTDVAQ